VIIKTYCDDFGEEINLRAGFNLKKQMNRSFEERI
jgi:hypothetical protein